jgi:hypothetical protein
VGHGSSDVHVMLHVNRLDGLAKRTVLSDDGLSVLVPILEDLFNWKSTNIRAFFESHGFVLQEWTKFERTLSRSAERA